MFTCYYCTCIYIQCRFQVDDSIDISPTKKPLPESDDSDGFYSPEKSSPTSNQPHINDEPAANVVIATKSSSFIASAEEEEQQPPSPSELSPLK